MLKKIITAAMSEFSPKVWLTESVRDRCAAVFSEFPTFVLNNTKINKTAAVLLPLVVVDGEVALLYTLRSSNLKGYSGQVSFPGGMTDKGENAIETALRETEEEIGVPRSSVDVWTQMSPVQGRNKELLITPVVGVIKDFDFNELNPNPSEVEEVFTVPLRLLSDPATHGHLKWEGNMIPVYLHGKHKIWGITAFITEIFLQVLLPRHLYNPDFARQEFSDNELMSGSSKL